ncbi:MAG: ABC transporter substrate-binding protein [Actinomycetota bacterium]|nr:ABC transporter substrate-binding protein [Actinomycetota bacterium]
MKMTVSRLQGALAVLVAALAIGACGGDDSGGGGSGGGGGGGGGEQTAVRQGGELRFAYPSFPDYVDPQLAYTVAGLQVLDPVYKTLITYRREEGTRGSELIPGLAEALPQISEDGRTYRLRLREGLRYSDGSPVRARDFEHSIKRMITMEGGASPFYTGAIAGADEYQERGRANGDISGITTNDETRDITIRLNEANGQFPYLLAFEFAALVPSDTPFENQTQSPPPGNGPYRIASVEGSRQIVLERNPNWKDIPGIPRGNVDRITVDVMQGTRGVQEVLQNRADWMDDVPGGDLTRQFRQTAGDRYRDITQNSTYYFFLNERTPPFDDLRVRQAINFAADKRALARIAGGQITPGCNFIPPGMQGYQKIDPCPYGDPNAAPNVERARQLIREAGVQGERVTVWGNDESDTRPRVEYLTDIMNQIGLRAEPRIVDGSVYFQTIGNQRTRAQAGFANWFQDYPHPGNFLFLVAGSTIQPTNNQNFGNVNDPVINRGIDELNPRPLTETAEGWAQLDRRVIDQAHGVVYGHRRLPLIASNRVAFDRVIHHPVLQVDFTSFALKQQ